MDARDRPAVPAFAAGMTRAGVQTELRRALADAGVDSAALDARLLAAAALGVTATSLLARPDLPLGHEEAARLAGLAERRLAREPVARILGEAEFWGLPFRLSPETLVPRPDTETVVAAALDSLRDRDAPHVILDLGTGSGCILVALLSELKGAFGIGVDRSPRALSTARSNAEANGVASRAVFVASHWAAALTGRYDLIVSNPPYIPAGDIQELEPEVSRFDPAAALDGGDDGLLAYRAILAQAAGLLSADGRLLFELGHDQAESVGELAAAEGFAVESVRRDLAGHTRAMVLSRRTALVSGG